MAQAQAFPAPTLAKQGAHRAAALLRIVVMGLISFLTFVDLFAAHPVLTSTLGNPAIPASKKKALVSALVTRARHHRTRRLVNVAQPGHSA